MHAHIDACAACMPARPHGAHAHARARRHACMHCTHAHRHDTCAARAARSQTHTGMHACAGTVNKKLNGAFYQIGWVSRLPRVVARGFLVQTPLVATFARDMLGLATLHALAPKSLAACALFQCEDVERCKSIPARANSSE
eukprot:10931214-Alexandrium_andersonii.AAC.1